MQADDELRHLGRNDSVEACSDDVQLALWRLRDAISEQRELEFHATDLMRRARLPSGLVTLHHLGIHRQGFSLTL